MPPSLLSPAPKYAGLQAAPKSFWESESDRYWEKCRRKRLKGKAVAAISVLLAIMMITLVVAVWMRRKSESAAGVVQTALPADSVSEPTDDIRLKTQACIGSGGKGELESTTCAKACAKARNAVPRPLAHRSCLAGCRAGTTAAWDLGCAGGRQRDCVDSAGVRCDEHCAIYRNQFPKPTVFNYCHHACVDVVESACLKAKEVFVAAHVFSGSLKDEF